MIYPASQIYKLGVLVIVLAATLLCAEASETETSGLNEKCCENSGAFGMLFPEKHLTDLNARSFSSQRQIQTNQKILAKRSILSQEAKG